MHIDGSSQGVAEVVDLFCGVGALSHGLMRAGLTIRAGIDLDPECRFAFEVNNAARFIAADVGSLSGSDVASHYTGTLPTVLAGCAPCQPFSTYKFRYEEDPRWELISSFSRIVTEVRPDFVTMENVPTLVRYQNGKLFQNFCENLEKNGYSVAWSIAACEKFGLPQRRRRLVLIASRHAIPSQLSGRVDDKVTVRKAISALPPLGAGESDPDDPLHTASSLTETNLKRIRASKPGGSWRDWPDELVAKCHRKESGQTYPGVYARMEWDDVAPTMTTQCFGFGNGRFGHPEQDRAISLREAAILQSFPADYKFLPTNERVAFKKVGRWIGNAVPVILAEEIGHQIAKLIRDSIGAPNERRKEVHL